MSRTSRVEQGINPQSLYEKLKNFAESPTAAQSVPREMIGDINSALTRAKREIDETGGITKATKQDLERLVGELTRNSVNLN